jgi:hypothetical protein
MQVDYKKYIKPIILGALAIIVIFCLIKKPQSIKIYIHILVMQY